MDGRSFLLSVQFFSVHSTQDDVHLLYLKIVLAEILFKLCHLKMVADS